MMAGQVVVAVQSSRLHRVAQWYARQGWPVFPCLPKDKRPATEHGLKDASQAIDAIDAWWASQPEANIGVATGAALGAFALDVDGEEGEVSLAALEQEHGPLPPTLEQHTGRGRHLFFRMPVEGDVRNSAGQLGQGLDIRGSGGYAIVAPSVHPSGEAYRWAEGRSPDKMQPAEAPPWLIEAVRQKPQPAPTPRAEWRPSAGNRAYAEAALEDEAARVAQAPEGQRNAALNVAAHSLGQLVGAGELDQGEVDAELTRAAVHAGLDAVETARTIKSGLAAGMQKPREVPSSTPATFGLVIRKPPPASTEEWPEPDMSVLDAGLAPPQLPVDVFGPYWAGWLTAHAAQSSVPPDYVAAPLLGVAAAAIGNARVASPWPGWLEPSILWVAKIGAPSTGKTPGDNAVLSLVARLEAKIAEGFDETLRQHQTDALAAKLAKEEWENAVRAAVENGHPPPIQPERAVVPTQPKRPRLRVADPTPEAMGLLMEAHQKGLMLHRDELAGFLGGFDKYGGGSSERPFWAEAYNGGYHAIDRVKHPEPIRIQHLAVSIVGGIQPDRLNSLLLKGDDDGLPARFLVVWPEPLPPRRPTATVADGTAYEALGRLHSLEMGLGEDGQPVRVTVPLTEEAADVFQKWREVHHEGQPLSGMFASHYGKLPGSVLRLALVIEHLWWAAEGGTPPASIGINATNAAAGLVTDYFLPMARRAYGDAVLPDDERDARTIARWIVRNRIDRINARKLYRQAKLPGLTSAKAVNAALDYLEEAACVWPAPSRVGDRPGRQRGDYIVNPKLRGQP